MALGVQLGMIANKRNPRTLADPEVFSVVDSCWFQQQPAPPQQDWQSLQQL